MKKHWRPLSVKNSIPLSKVFLLNSSLSCKGGVIEEMRTIPGSMQEARED